MEAVIASPREHVISVVTCHSSEAKKSFSMIMTSEEVALKARSLR
jgi:hypothetical protein